MELIKILRLTGKLSRMSDKLNTKQNNKNFSTKNDKRNLNFQFVNFYNVKNYIISDSPHQILTCLSRVRTLSSHTLEANLLMVEKSDRGTD